jgi:hypothetical protein
LAKIDQKSKKKKAQIGPNWPKRPTFSKIAKISTQLLRSNIPQTALVATLDTNDFYFYFVSAENGYSGH